MTRSSSSTRHARRTSTILVPLSLGLAVAGALGWQAWSAERTHRRAAEQTVRDYADFAATLLAAEATTDLEQTLFYAFYAADQAERRGSGPVTAEALAANPPEAERCAADYPGGRWYARLLPGDSGLTIVGPVPTDLRTWLTDTLSVLVRGTNAMVSPYGNLFPPGPDPGVVAYRIQSDSTGRPVAAYALAHCFTTRNGSVFATAESASVLLPPGLVGHPPADSILSLRVLDPRGRTVFRSPVEWRSAFEGTRTADASGPLAGLSFVVTLRPSVADQLVVGGIPPSRLPLTAALVLLAGALLVATVLQVRRALALVHTRERFVADVSHELRTPLQQILMFVQLLRMGGLRSQREEAASLQVIEREAQRLIRLVERLLDFAGGDRGQDPDEQADLFEVALETVRSFEASGLADGADLQLHGSPGAWARAPADAIRQIVSNLLDNALKYGPQAQRIDIRVTATGSTVRLVVDDEGPGVPIASRADIWRPFRRLEHAQATHTTGSGVGLAIVADLAERAGGHACVEDAPTGGARFLVELPATTGSRTEPADA